MFGFGKSKKDDGKSSGVFGLPNIPLGKADKAISQGLGQVENTLKQTGKKVEDFLFGHSSSTKDNSKIVVGFGLPDISLGKAEKAVGHSLGQAGHTITKTEKKVEDILFGHSKHQNSSDLSSKHETNIGGSLGVPGLSVSISGKDLVQSIRQADDSLKNTGKKVEDFLFGNSKGPSNNTSLSFNGDLKPNGSFGSNGISLGKSEVGLTQLGNKLKHTGEKVEDFLFGHSKNQKGNEVAINNDLKVNGSFGLPGIGEADTGLTQVGNKLKHTGEKVEGFLFGHSKSQKQKNDTAISSPRLGGVSINTGELSNRKTNLTGQDGNLGRTGDDLKKVGEKTLNGLFGEHNTVNSTFSLGISTPKLPFGGAGHSDVGKKINEGVEKIGNKVEKTGKKGIDYIFGKENKPTSNTIDSNTTDSNKINTGVEKPIEITTTQNEMKRNDSNVEVPGIPTAVQLTDIKNDAKISLNGGTEKITKGIATPDLISKGNTNSHAFLPTIKNTTGEEDAKSTFSLPEKSLSSLEATEVSNTGIYEANTGSLSNSLEESATGMFGEIPSHVSTKSEESLRKIEDILKGSGTITPVPTSTVKESEIKYSTPQGRTNFNRPISPEFTYTNEISHENGIIPKPKTRFHTSIIEEVINSTTPEPNTTESGILPPYFVVPKKNVTIGDDSIPQLPPTVFDKPIGDRAHFIPILPPMESSTRSINGPSPSKFPNTLAPNMPSISRSLTPAEYGAIGVGSVLIFALIAYIYQKYRQYTSSSSGGSYSPKTRHRTAAGRRGSTKSDESGGEPNEVYKATTQDEPEEVVVVEITSKIDKTEEVSEVPITKTVVNGLQKSSTENRETPLISDSFTVISETQKPSPLEKPPRKSKTSIGSPEKFTSDKTSASTLNEDSLKTVTHAIGGILRSQAPNSTEKLNRSPEESNVEEDECSDDTIKEQEGISLIGKSIDQQPNKKNQNTLVVEVHAKADKPERDPTDSEPLYKSLDKETDAGSEYYSADENSDIKNSPPGSPVLEKDSATISGRNLRAEDVYNAEITTEDGRRRSTEEDIAESIESSQPDTQPTDEISENVDHKGFNEESIKPSAPPLFQEESPILRSSYDTEHNCTPEDINQGDIPQKTLIQNLLNVEKSNYQQYRKQEAEVIIDDILKASQLDAQTRRSIKEDLGTSEVHTSKVAWSNNNAAYINHYPLIINSENEGLITGKRRELDSSRCSETKLDFNSEKTPFSTFPADANTIAQVEPSGHAQFQDNNATMIENEMLQQILDDFYQNKAEKNIITSDSSPDNELDKTKSKSESVLEEGESSYVKIESSAPPSHMTEYPSKINECDDEGVSMEHRFEFIPPRQPQLLEDDLIVFSNSDRESISPLCDSNSEGKSQNEECPTSNEKKEENYFKPILNPIDPSERIVGEYTEALIGENTLKHSDLNGEENAEHRTKWYVPDDELSDPELKNEGDKSGGGLFIVLSQKTPKISTGEETSKIESNAKSVHEYPRKPKTSNISYAFIEVNDDPRYETWPEHLPKNIHSISGVGLAKATNNGSLYDVLKEEESEVLPSTSTLQRNTKVQPGSSSTESDGSSKTLPKPIPKFIIPNMDARLSKKRVSRRRQIKSLDSGVHHYYGEYLNLVEFPENERAETNGDGNKKEISVIEEVVTIKPDGTITEEKIVIE